MKFNNIRSISYWFKTDNIYTLRELKRSNEFHYFIYHHKNSNLCTCVISNQSGYQMFYTSICNKLSIPAGTLYRVSNASTFIESFVIGCVYNDWSINDRIETTGVYDDYVNRIVKIYDL